MSILVIHQNQNKIKDFIKGIVIELDSTYGDSRGILKEIDVHIIESETSSIGIEEVKLLLYSLQYKPLSHEKQFGIILNAYLLTTEAQNVLLKSLEEPSKNTEFILGTRSITDVLPTIRSRCTINYVSAETEGSNIPHECTKFIEMKPYERFIFIKEYSKTHKKKEEIEQFVIGLIEIYRNKSHNSKTLADSDGKNLKLLNEAYRYWQSNVNKQMLLEYIAINLVRSS